MREVGQGFWLLKYSYSFSLALLQIYIFCKQWSKILEIERMFDPFDVLQGNGLGLVLWFIGMEAQ